MVDELRHVYADVDGVRLHWAELGTRSAQHVPLVLLHGLTDSHLTWRPVATQLARDRLVLMPDFPGCGLSERPNASYELDWQAQMIARWLEQLELSSVDVIGHSYGGGVAQILLLVCPQRIRRIVLAASGGLGRDVGFWLKLATFPHAVEHLGQPFMAFGTRRALGGHSQEAEAKDDVASLSEMNAERGTARAFSRMVRDVIDWRGQTRLFLQRAHEVGAFPPITVFWGEGDTLIPSSHGQDFVALMQGVTLRSFLNCGHYLHQEQPEEFATAALAFLDDPSAPPAQLRPAEPGAELAERLARVARKRTVTLTHYGRKSGKAYRVTIWFTVDDTHINLQTMNMNRQWVRNVLASGRVSLQIGDQTFEGSATQVTAPADMARVTALMKRKYPVSLPYLWLKKRPAGAFHVRIDP